jgi:class 3 adenylate cyclase/TolB-like protein/Flp pilus assembly protein TadD
MSETRKLAAILVSDVVGYSRLAGADEERTLARLRGLRSDLIDPAIAAHHGRIVKRTGDGSIVEFRSVVDAVRCAIEVQNGLAERNAGLPPDRRIEFRVGIHLGDVVVEEDGDLMGDGVNIAARLEGIAKPGAICLSEDAYRQVKGRFEIAVSDLGATQLKNIAEPIRVYSLDVGAPAKRKTFSRRVPNLAVARTLDFLRRLLFPVALGVVLAAAGAFAWHSGVPARLLNRSIAQQKLATAPRLSIVVLPFENLSGDPAQEYFVDGITDDLTTDLSRIPDSFVIARNTAFTYKGKAVDAKAIGRELSVRYLLEGSARRTGDTVEVNAQLVSTETGAHVWADRFEAERSNVGRLQFEVVARIAHSLGEELVKAESLRAIRERPKNPDAVDLATRGEAILLSNSFNKSAWNDAIKLFERSLALDPQNMTAMTALAVALDTRADNHWSEDPAGDIARADELTNAAMALQSDNTWVHWAKARLFASKLQWRSALTEAEMAIADDRNNARAYADAGSYKMYLGRGDEGISDIETALRLSPHENQVREWQTHLCYAHDLLGQWEQAIDWCTKAAANNPSHGFALAALANAYAWSGHDKEAKDVVAQLKRADPNFSVQLWQHRVSDDPTFNAQMDRAVEGLRKAGVPEGPVKTN